VTVLAGLTRRRTLGVCAAVLVTHCARTGARCAYCGMPLDPKSAWNAQLVSAGGTRVDFDSPRCALLAWRSGQVDATEILVQDYYDRAWRSGREVVFVASSDVSGPMGADLVPLDPARAPQFTADHTGTRPFPLEQITLPLLKELR
jgi:hypothetical protein